MMVDQTDSGLRVALQDVHPLLDGEYPLDPEGFTNRDLHDIKRIAGVLPLEFGEALQKGDSDLIVALAVIALRKAGKPAYEDALWDAPIGKITLLGEEADAVPPQVSTPPSTPDSSVEQSESSGLSGLTSPNGSAEPVVRPSVTGAPV